MIMDLCVYVWFTCGVVGARPVGVVGTMALTATQIAWMLCFFT